MFGHVSLVLDHHGHMAGHGADVTSSQHVGPARTSLNTEGPQVTKCVRIFCDECFHMSEKNCVTIWRETPTVAYQPVSLGCSQLLT